MSSCWGIGGVSFPPPLGLYTGRLLRYFSGSANLSCPPALSGATSPLLFSSVVTLLFSFLGGSWRLRCSTPRDHNTFVSYLCIRGGTPRAGGFNALLPLNPPAGAPPFVFHLLLLVSAFFSPVFSPLHRSPFYLCAPSLWLTPHTFFLVVALLFLRVLDCLVR